MNPAALLALISSLYEQLSAALQRIEELEAEAAGPPPSNGSDPVKDPAKKEKGVAGRG